MKAIVKTRAISVAAALVLGVSGVGIAAAQAEAAETGTVTSTEARKLLKEVTNQKCLTMDEAKKIVHGQGEYDDGSIIWHGPHDSRVDYVTVTFPKQCITWVTVVRKETSGPHTYKRPTGKVGTVTKAESRKLAKEMFNQKCLSWAEARKIAHGRGDSEDTLLQWPGAKGSNIKWFSMEDYGDGCLHFATIIRK